MPSSLPTLRQNYAAAQNAFDAAVERFNATSDALAAAEAAFAKAGVQLNAAYDAVLDAGVLLGGAGETTRVVTIKDLDLFAAIGRARDAGKLHANLESLRPKNPEAC